MGITIFVNTKQRRLAAHSKFSVWYMYFFLMLMFDPCTVFTGIRKKTESLGEMDFFGILTPDLMLLAHLKLKTKLFSMKK